MKAICVICGELLELSDGICAISCGHIFHGHCLLQWLERSKSCPQCRLKTREKNIIKLYFDAPASEPSQLDAVDLQHQLDNQKFQIFLRDKEIKDLKDDISLKLKQVEGLKDECKNLEKKLKKNNEEISSLKTQIEYVNQAYKDIELENKKSKGALAKLKKLEIIQNLIDESSDDIEETLLSYCHPNNKESIQGMATFICILKKQLKKINTEKKKTQDAFDSLKRKHRVVKKNLNCITNNYESLKKDKSNLVEDNEALERETRSLNKKISSLENAIQSPSGDVTNSLITRLLKESPIPFELKKVPPPPLEDFVDLTPEIIRKIPQTCEESSIIDDQIKQRIYQTKRSSSNAASFGNKRPNSYFAPSSSILTNDRRATLQPHSICKLKTSNPSSENEIGFDGMGGHSRPDIFPRPSNNSSLLPTRRPRSKAHKFIFNRMNSNESNILSVPHQSIKSYFKNTFDED